MCQGGSRSVPEIPGVHERSHRLGADEDARNVRGLKPHYEEKLTVGLILLNCQSVKLKRVVDTETDPCFELLDLVSGNDVKKSSPLDKIDDAVEENALIPHETFTRSWRPTFAREISDTGIRYHESLLKEIGALTNCRVELEADGVTISARAENLHDVENAMMKLKIIDDWAVSLTFYWCSLNLTVFSFSISDPLSPSRTISVTQRESLISCCRWLPSKSSLTEGCRQPYFLLIFLP